MYRFYRENYKDYEVLSVEKIPTEKPNHYTHLALLLSPYSGAKMECKVVIQPTGNNGIDRFLLVKENMEYVQDDYV